MTFTKAIIAIIAVYALNLIAVPLGIYEAVRWFDIPMHFAGGFAMGMLGLAVWYQSIDKVTFKGKLEKHLAFWFVPLFVTGFVAIVAILWEAHEFILDRLFNIVTQPSIGDTMLDLLLGILGALISTLVFYRKT